MRLFVRHWSARFRQLQGGDAAGGGALPEPAFGRLSFDAFADQGRPQSRIWGTFDLGRQLRLLASAIWNVGRWRSLAAPGCCGVLHRLPSLP